MITLEIGDKYFPAFNVTRGYEVVRKHIYRGEVNGYYLVYFKGDCSRVAYICVGDDDFHDKWFKTYEEARDKELENAKRTVHILEKLKNDR